MEMTHIEALTSALSQAHQYWQMCITAARKAEAIGDIASRDKELADADRKAAQIDWYREQLAMAAVPLTYPKIETQPCLEAAE
jgi:hypothetical protein